MYNQIYFVVDTLTTIAQLGALGCGQTRFLLTHNTVRSVLLLTHLHSCTITFVSLLTHVHTYRNCRLQLKPFCSSHTQLSCNQIRFAVIRTTVVPMKPIFCRYTQQLHNDVRVLLTYTTVVQPNPPWVLTQTTVI